MFFAFPIKMSANTNLTSILQQALFEEEANHNLNAAIQSYQSLVTQFDQDRKLAATAIFRLGECYRKQGNTNDATAQYERIVRDFSDQSTLLNLCRQNLASLGIAPPAPASSGTATAARAEQKRLLEEEIKLAEKQLASQQKLVETGAMSTDGVIPFQRDLLKLRRQLAALDAGQSPSDLALDTGATTTAEAEEVKRIQALIKDSPDLINSSELLQIAAGKGEIAIVKLLLDSGAAVDGIKQQAPTPLHYAAANGHKAVVDLLLSKGAKADARTESGGTPLHLAAFKGYELVAKALLAAGAPVDARMRADATVIAYGFKAGQTPLHVAASAGYTAIVELLLSKGADVNAEDGESRTALSHAAANGDGRMTKALLAAHADPNAGHRDLPLVMAAYRGDAGLLELLLTKGADPNTNSITGAADGQTKVPPLYVAVKYGRAEAVKILTRAKADPNVPNKEGKPLLFDAAGNLETLKALLDGGADPNQKARDGFTPLTFATHQLNRIAVETLLTHHADPNAKMEASYGEGGKGYTPLLIATARFATNLVDVLLAAGADPNLRSDTRAPLLNAMNNENPPARKQMAASLLDHGAKPDARDTDGKTPLMFAVLRGDKDSAALLLANKADVNAASKDGTTPLHLAVALNCSSPTKPIRTPGTTPARPRSTWPKAPPANAANPVSIPESHCPRKPPLKHASRGSNASPIPAALPPAPLPPALPPIPKPNLPSSALPTSFASMAPPTIFPISPSSASCARAWGRGSCSSATPIR